MALFAFKTRRLQKASLALNNGKYKEALKLASPLAGQRNKDLAFQANRICGLALYKLKQYESSLSFLNKACALGNYRHDWYNLAMANAYAGKVDASEEAFQNIYRTNVQPGYMYAVPVPGLLFQYVKVLIKKEFIEAATARANEMKQMYSGVGKDMEKQVARGLPSYEMFRKELVHLFSEEKLAAWEKGLK